ncbi:MULTISPECIES: hypothetical protein [unclassified Mesorhizobium]|uniref:hypothetical protein n=1 Tax=unclassified Mesorhizobium TaxID=325217 RepID=UPI003337E278
MLNIVDDVTRECLAAIPDTSISTKRSEIEMWGSGNAHAAQTVRSNIQAGISSHRSKAWPETLQRKTTRSAFSITS